MLRFLWQAVNLTDDFYGAFSHDADEGAVRVYDRGKTPGLDTWTYGFHPTPRNLGPVGPNTSTGYAEMWGGTVRTFPSALGTGTPLGPGGTLAWSEYLVPFHGTKGLTRANARAAAHATAAHAAAATHLLTVRLCPTRPLVGATASVVTAGGHVVATRSFDASPDAPATLVFDLDVLGGAPPPTPEGLQVAVTDRDGENVITFAAPP